MAEFVKTFMDKSAQPTGEMVGIALGKSHPLWLFILNHIQDNYGETVEEWKFYSASYGWTLKTLLKKRNLFFFGAAKGSFRVTFVFGDKAVKEIEKSNLPKDLITELLSAKKYAEGRGISIIVKTKKDAANVCKLIDLKVAN